MHMYMLFLKILKIKLNPNYIDLKHIPIAEYIFQFSNGWTT